MSTRPSRIPFRTSSLIQIAGGVFIAGATTLYLLQRTMQKRVRELPHYRETFNIISKHEGLLNALGKPIQIGRVDLADRRSNYVDRLESKLKIPVSGPMESGFINVLAIRKDENDKFITKQLEFESEEGSYLFYQI